MLKSVTVAFLPLRHCLINLPAAWANALLDQGKLSQNVVLELSWQEGSTEKKSYVGWSGGACNNGNGSTGAANSATPSPPRPLSGAQTGDMIEMDPMFGQAMGLRAGQKVNIEFVKSVQDGISVNVAPYSEDDWEILELHAGYVEDQMLNQIRILYPNQIATMWINGHTLVRLRVLDINPAAKCVKLGANAEVIVAPMVRKANGLSKLSENQDLSAQVQKVTQAQCLRVLALSEVPEELVRNITGSSGASGTGQGQGQGAAFHVYIHPESWIDADLTNQPALRISKVVSPHAEKASDDENRDPEDLLVGSSAIFARVISSKSVPIGHVAISKQVQDALDAENFAIVKLSEPHIQSVQISSITLRPISSSGSTPATPAPLKLQPKSANHDSDKAAKSANLISIFKEWVDSIPGNNPIILSHGSLLTIPNGDTVQSFSIVFPLKSLPSSAHSTQQQSSEEAKNQPEPEAFSIMTKPQISQLKVEIGQPQGVSHVFKKTVNHLADTPASLGGVSQVCSKAEKYLLASLSKLELRDALAVPNLGGVLLCGPHGSGKTVVARSIIRKLSNNINTLAYCLEINCAEFAEDRITVLMTKFQQWFDTAAFHSPSILFLEDLDRLIPAEVEHADSFRSRQIAEVFLQIASRMCKRFDRITIVATAQQQVSVHPSLITSHLLSEIIRLTPPGKTERKEMLQSLMETGPAILKRSLPHIDLVSVASKTEGYLAADLKAFLERTVHEGAVRNIAAQTQTHTITPQSSGTLSDEKNETIESTLSTSPNTTLPSSTSTSSSENDFILTQADFLKAQEGFVPSSLRGVKLQSSATSWLDIGGLNETRKVLLETLEWPTKYSSIFSQCPLRLRSGLLLFGHPGCGKTLLASAVAKECGLNFISVKGPELLNKYIGASEKSVRDLFERAQAAKPCVLFFDEFDSIAPKRGHDSTGVTDRVVNQMLTQMDGAEGLDGVYVLAATSRPDLIDPALLRPGRLDKSLLCGMPNVQDRFEILTCLARKMEVAEDVDLMEVARRTEGLTGADLQAVLYNAHLEAIRVAIEKDEAIKRERQDNSTGTGTDASPSVIGGSTGTTIERSGGNDGKAVRFVSLGGRGFAGAGKSGKKANLTLAERGQISSRLGLIAKGMDAAREAGRDHTTSTATAPKSSRPIITREHLEVSMTNTRSSITPEESQRLDLIYTEFLGDRTGEMSNGTGSHELGQRTTLA
ncbi:P-loop containing nucleoside triphosphate hydrolase protein [Lobosporangium transversale]|uniref:Peroxisomal ATPase PEX1 n=1 Tax=Lobosporangium transversale TaxID=64571 RepID=A0A1Y2GZC8_9FUNG|nr:P-loop containing nucleoside triphosphate hydrolase protein [Lobosporangium transversale]ORZ24946.1 P-loop containing nucleoside triphosphate hydrolase protein [Lobosporangium transversale]|eukprot:XP_021883927.1 P-loop containing nucleoside triphosphate hydrolase protein [Lobosporangium transversale]